MATAPPLTPNRTISAPRPGPMEQRLLQRIGDDIRRERRVRRRAELPPGSLAPSWSNTRAIIADPLSLLLEHERRFGPVFTIRLLHEPIVWAIGAEVNHQILVSDFDAFQWREGRFADLWPLLGDGLLNVDGPYHRDFRMLMLPAFHRDYIAALAETMIEEATGAAERLEDGRVVEIYHWVRELALRIALRGLLGLDATDGRERALARAFEASLAIHGEPVPLQLLPLPRSPLARAIAARRALDALVRAEIEDRRRRGDAGHGVLGLLLSATDEAGSPLPTGVVRDQAVTLLFAGHDTTTTTFTFLIHELGRNPSVRSAVEEELDARWRQRRSEGRRARRPGPAGARARPQGDAPLLSGRLGRPAPDDARRDAGRRTRPGRDRRAVLVLGHPSPAPAVSGSVPLRPGSLPARARGRPAARRLHPVRRRLAHVPGQALRRVRAARAGGGAAHPRPLRARARPPIRTSSPRRRSGRRAGCTSWSGPGEAPGAPPR